ncbi:MULTISPECIES: YesK family protein [Solibacillus]|uniref:Sodium:dicarboxylate symporter n=1 Tax=Solibacillus merdavium TaxID=2762218 RepID=A0ABR8XLZ2_9BACL|nr:YesK family protein [Solibacillus merdavium]MBD8032948.1 sodium:dicarboxylate symporter [Solibacillus merdavium]
MDILMLDGWTPLLLIGIVAAIGIFITSRKVSRKSIFSISTVISLICIVVFIYSIIGVGGWEGMGLGIISFIILAGIWIGTFIGVASKV